MQLVFIHVAYVCESSRWSAGLFRSELVLVFLQSSVWGGGTSVKVQLANGQALWAVWSLLSAHGCVPGRLHAQSRLAVGRIESLSLSMPACHLSPPLASYRVHPHLLCLLWIYSLYSQNMVQEKLNTDVPLFISSDCSPAETLSVFQLSPQ